MNRVQMNKLKKKISWLKNIIILKLNNNALKKIFQKKID